MINDEYLTSKSFGKMPPFVLARQLDYDETIPRDVAKKTTVAMNLDESQEIPPFCSTDLSWM